MQAAVAAMLDYLGGNAGAVALTLATAVFFWSGEAYHRAWEHGGPPNDALNRRGDLLSAIGALVLGRGAAQPRAGDARRDRRAAARGRQVRQRLALADDARVALGLAGLLPPAVLASRVPALLAALIDLPEVLARFGAATPWTAVADAR